MLIPAKWSPFSITLVFAFLALTGFLLIPRLPVRWLPANEGAVIRVLYDWPGTGSQLLEQQVTAPLEAAFSMIRGVADLESRTQIGSGSIDITIKSSENAEFVRFSVAAAVRRVYPELPAGVSYPQVTLHTGDAENAQQAVITGIVSSGQVTGVELSRYIQENILPEFALTQNLAEIAVIGTNKPQWEFTYNYELLKTLGIKPGSIDRAIRQHLKSDLAGFIENQGRQIPVRHRSTDHLTGWEQIPIANVERRLITLGQIAVLKQIEQVAPFVLRRDGQNAVRLLFMPKSEANIPLLATLLRKKIVDIQQTLPPAYHLNIEEDVSVKIDSELSNMSLRFGLSLFLQILFVWFAYGNPRYIMLALAGLVLNLGLAFLGYWCWGITFHLYALAGITMSLGFIVDNTLVMAHHIERENDTKIGFALACCTLTMIAGLSAFFFLPKSWQWNLIDFSKVIIINLISALVISLTAIPALAAQFSLNAGRKVSRMQRLRRIHIFDKYYASFLKSLLRRKHIVIICAVLLFGLPVFMLPQKMEGCQLYNDLIGSRYYQDKLRPWANIVLGGTLRLFSQHVVTKIRWEENPRRMLIIEGTMPTEARFSQLDSTFQRIEKWLSGYPLPIGHHVTYLNRRGNRGYINILLPRGCTLSEAGILKSRTISLCLEMGGIRWSIYGVGQGFSNDFENPNPSFHIELTGYDREAIVGFAGQFAQKLALNPHITDIDIGGNTEWWEKDVFEYYGNTDARLTALRHLSSASLNTALLPYDKYPEPNMNDNRGIPIQIKSDISEKYDFWRLKHRIIKADSFYFTWPGIGGDIQKTIPADAINKKNQQYIHAINAKYSGAINYGYQYLYEKIEQMNKELPFGYEISSLNRHIWGGEKNVYWYKAVGIVSLLIFVICAIHFESLRQAWVNLVLIPLSYVGVFLIFYLFNLSFDQGGFASFILLSGLVVNSLVILLSDYNNQRKKRKFKSDTDAWRRAFQRKIIPVLLTILPAVLGMAPFLFLGSEEPSFWAALSAGTIGGMLFSLVVLLVFTPAFLLRKK